VTDGVSFDLDGGLALALLRAVSVAGLFSVFGGLVFRAIVAPPALARLPVPRLIEERLRSLVLISIAVNLVATLGWLILQAADLSDAPSFSASLAALPTVLSRTTFGHVLTVQVAVMVALVPCLWLATPVALALSAAGIVLQAGHSHAAAMDGGLSLLLAADVVHLLSGGAWLGGLLPLLLFVWWAPPKVGAVAARWFSPMGQVCIAGMVLSASYQGWVLVESWQGLFGSAYGWVVLSKTALFVVLFGFAVANRYWFGSNLARSGAKHMLMRSIALQTCVGVLVLSAAAILSGLAPPMKM
jgi:putative copper resistance protein D